MVAYYFQDQFAYGVENLHKRQTIRRKRNDGKDAKPGVELQLYTGMRQKNKCRLLKRAICTETNDVTIYSDAVFIDGTNKITDPDDLHQFAIDDGFFDWKEMRTWFENTYDLSPTRPFEGILIKW